MHDQRLRFMLSFIPRRRYDHAWDPAVFVQATSTPPTMNDFQTSVDGIEVEIADGHCKLEVPIFDSLGQFNADLGWKLTGKRDPSVASKPYLHRSVFLPLREMEDAQTDVPRHHGGFRVLEREDGELEDLGGSVWEPIYHLELQLLLVLQPPARKPDPVYFDWEKRFFPGGLPSLGKRA